MTDTKVSAAPTTPPEGTSPSPSINRAIKESWHPTATTDAKTALKGAYNKDTVNPSELKK